jgi:hypothetical protein
MIAGQDRVRSRRCAAPPRQQRGVDVDGAETGNVEHRFRKDLPVCDDDHKLWRDLPQALNGGRLADPLGLKHVEPQLKRRPLHGRSRQLQAAARRPVGLRDHELDVVTGRMKGFE